MFSIRRHLLRWQLAALAFGSVLLALATYAFALDEMNEVFDEQLKQVALTVLTHAEADPQPRPAVAAEDMNGYAFVTQVWTLHGELVASTAGDVKLPFSAKEGFETVSSPAGDWRVYTDRSEHRLIQAAQAVKARHALAADVAVKNLIPSLAALPLVALLLAYALRRGLEPLARTSEAIHRKSAASLEPIDTASLPIELRPLVDSMNTLIAKLQLAMDEQRRFTADAAHELRTPLTALRLQVRELLGAKDEASRAAARWHTEQGLNRATHLVQQLLTLASVEPDRPPVYEPIDLGAMAKLSVTDFSARAEERGIDLGAVVPEDRVGAHQISGERDTLQVLFNNLVDNALRYTPPGGRVDVCVSSEPSDEVINVAVCDSGPGLPPAEHAAAFRRFYRGGNTENAEGSGLGLAIVKAAAARHGAALELDSGLPSSSGSPGLTVRVKFPRHREVCDREADKAA